MQKEIIVLGGGYSGVLTAKKIAKKIKKNKLMDQVSITLIDKNPFHTMLTELHEVAANRVEEESIKMDLKKIFAGRNVNIKIDTIDKIDFDAKTLQGKHNSYSYDYLVLGSGSKPAYFGTEGAEENSFSLWSFDDAIKLKEHFLTTFRKAEKEPDAKERKKLLSFYIVGGGFTGVEMAGELAEWMPQLCNDFHIDPSEVTMVIADMVDRLMTSLPEKLSLRVTKRLTKMKFNIKLNTKVISVGKDFIVLEENSKQNQYETSTVIWTAGIESSTAVKNSEIDKVRGGRVETDAFLQSKQYENVYVVGDNMYFIPDGEKESVPQMVENCELSAGTAAHNMMVDLTGKGKKEKYQPKFHGMMVCVGGRYGSAYVGTHKTKFALPSFLAMLSKHFINIIYFIQVLGWNKIYSYIQHEFLRIRNNRSFLGGHFSNYSPNFWMVPLRIALGVSWLKEGLDKLPQILADPTHIFLFSLPNADATTQATEAAATYGEALPVPEFISNIVDWSMGVFIAPIAPVFQAFMVIAEIVIGVCLILGLFTAIISIFSCMISAMIYFSGMASNMILWYFLAGFAMIGIGGTGHVFSVDYYLMPLLKKHWKKIKFVKKWYLYND